MAGRRFKESIMAYVEIRPPISITANSFPVWLHDRWTMSLSPCTDRTSSIEYCLLRFHCPSRGSQNKDCRATPWLSSVTCATHPIRDHASFLQRSQLHLEQIHKRLQLTVGSLHCRAHPHGTTDLWEGPLEAVGMGLPQRDRLNRHPFLSIVEIAEITIIYQNIVHFVNIQHGLE